MASMLEAFTRDSSQVWTLRKIFGEKGLGARNPPLVGSAEEIADELQSWVEETGVDGFNISRVVTPETLEDFVDLVVPILQERGIYKRDYEEGHTARETVRRRSGAPAEQPPRRILSPSSAIRADAAE